MELLLKRRYNCKDYCIGSLYINGKYFCDTIEDTDRGLDDSMTLKEILKRKIKGLTAIPVGVYGIIMNAISPKFSKKQQYQFCKGKLPRLINVKGFDGVLIHIGNTAKDSEGCILVGYNKIKGQVTNSTDTFRRLYAILLKAYEDKEGIYITIVRNY